MSETFRTTPISKNWLVPVGVLFFSIASMSLAGCAGLVSGTSPTTNNSPAKDTTPPSVTMTAPANGTTVTGTVAVSANATDNVAVASVQFQLDGANLSSPSTTAPYSVSWNASTASNGSHSLRAIATDTSGNSATSAAVTVTVNNSGTAPPTVSITAPAGGATVSGTVSITATASSSVGIASVQFQLDNANTGAADTTSPYASSWDTTKTTNGTHALRAIATDTSGNSTTSASVSVTVSNSTGSTPPSVPAGLAATAVSSSQISLTWSASTGAVTGYNVYRGGTKVATSTTTTYLDNGLAASTSYTYNVAAFDAAGNTSAQSAGASATTLASSGGGGGIPSALGWFQIPNTSWQSLCPSGQSGSCSAVAAAWSSGVADTTRNRLEFMGGGHTDYSGNEIYYLDLNNLTMNRLTNPDPVNSGGTDPDPSGNPNSRHTYGGLAYVPSTDQIYVHGGALYPSGFGSINTFLFSMSSNTWKRQDPVNGTAVTSDCCNYQTFADYDPQTDLVWYVDDAFLWSYNTHTNTQTQVSKLPFQIFPNEYETCVMDYKDRFFYCIGSGVVGRANMSATPPTFADITSQTSGCATLANNSTNPHPGLAYDPVQGKIIGWIGGSSVTVFDPIALTCTVNSTFTNGPGAAQGNGTFGRWRYFPALGVFALVNDWQQNAWTLRMTPASGTGGTGPAISGITVTSITTTGATVSWTTDVAATSQVEYGTTTSYGTLTTLDSTMVTSHSQSLSGLAVGTVYHYRVHSKNSSGVESISGDAVFSTNSSADTTPPTISISSPANGATLSGTVTVSANASDNVGVTSVQFFLDGANLGSALSASPYQVSWNTTAASNGTHALTATAKDAAGNVGNATAVSVTISNSGTATPLQDFQNRCNAAGVIVCEGFDEPTGIVRAGNVGTGSSGAEPANDGTTLPTQDTTTFTSGTGSLRFDLTVPSGTSNPDGYWRQLMQSSLSAGPSTAQVFSDNSTFYVQFRQMMSPAFISNTWGGTYWKQHIFATDSQSCGGTEATTVNDFNEGYPIMYSDCGADAFYVALSGGDELKEQGDTSTTGYNCHYQNSFVAPSSCFQYPANTWVTYTYEVQVGTMGSCNSIVKAWATTGGQGYAGHEWVNYNAACFSSNGASGAQGFNTVYLGPYLTGGYTGASGPATTWYDELIVSTQPIAAPNN